MKSKRHLEPIYFDSDRRIDYLGYFLLLIGAALFGLSIYSNLETSQQIKNTNAKIINIQNLTDSAQASKVDNDDPEKKEVAKKILKQINYPWNMFFSALEAAHTRDISLMAIQPNIDKKEALISAETASSHLMLQYIRTLEMQKGIDHIELLSQEKVADNQQERISFSVIVKFL